MGISMADTIKVGSCTIALTHTDKLFFPKSKISKGDVIAYYSHVAPYMISHVKNHPLTMQRFPEGITGESFYQKNISAYFPQWIKRVNIPTSQKEKVEYVIGNTPAIYVYLANQGCLTMHAWLSRYDKLYYPDRMIFDLDPSVHNFNAIRNAALLIKEIFDALKIPCFAMTTGSKGMHVMVPLKRVHTFDQVGAFAHAIAQKMLQERPKQFTLEIRKEKRAGKIFIDTLRNRYSATSVVPYSVRAYEKAPVAAPVWWPEVSDSSLTSQKFTIHTILQRLATEGDPWHNVHDQAISLKKIIKHMAGE